MASKISIDNLCRETTNAEMLNTLHACRDGHPLNNSHQWRNAYVMASQRRHEFSGAMVAWLRERAEQEQRAA